MEVKMKTDLFQQTEDLIKSGLKVKEACKKSGMTFTKYCYYKYQKGARKQKRMMRKQPEITTIPVNNTGKVLVLIGSSADIASTIERFL
jgi:hypothetical protein